MAVMDKRSTPPFSGPPAAGWNSAHSSGVNKVRDVAEKVKRKKAGRGASQKPNGRQDDRRERFAEIALPHVDRLYRYAMRLSHRPAEAEDLVQETYLRALRAFEHTEIVGDSRPWLFRILTNLFISRYRRRKREPRLTDFQGVEAYTGAKPAEEVPGDGALPAIGEQLDQRVKAALDSLAPEFRAVVLLAAVEELSYEEIAHVCGIPIGTVMSRLHRGRMQLRERLRGYAVEMGIKS
jgi:RNA polymerase sigma-70 factor (ECF subfamily)